MKKLLDLTLKDLRRAFGNIFGLVMMLAAPFLITGLIYFAFGGVGGDDGSFNLQPIQAQIVNLDEGIPGFNAGEQLSEFLISDSVAKIVEASRVDSESAARRAVDEQQSDVAVLSPQTSPPVQSAIKLKPASRCTRIQPSHLPPRSCGILSASSRTGSLAQKSPPMSFERNLTGAGLP
jgi:hypothetical protein